MEKVAKLDRRMASSTDMEKANELAQRLEKETVEERSSPRGEVG